MTTPMSEESIMATGTFSVRNEHDCYTLDDGTVGIDPVWFRQCLRSFAAWVIEKGKPAKSTDFAGYSENFSHYEMEQDDASARQHTGGYNSTIDEYASAMRKLIEDRAVEEVKPVPSEPFGIRDANPSCAKCHGVGSYSYDENHGKLCELCCGHRSGPYEFHDEAREYLNGYCSDGCGEKLT